MATCSVACLWHAPYGLSTFLCKYVECQLPFYNAEKQPALLMLYDHQ